MKQILLASLLILGCSKTENVNSPAHRSSYGSSASLEVNACDSLIVRKAVTVEPFETITVESPTAGVIDSLFFQKGDSVTEGDTLLQFESRELVAEIRLQKLRVAAAKNDMDRVASLYKKGVRTSIEKESAENVHREESAMLRMLRVRLAEYTLRSPVSGTVVFTENSKTYIGIGEEVCQVESSESGIAIPTEFLSRSIVECFITIPSLQKKIPVVVDSVEHGWIQTDLPVGAAGVMTLTLKIPNSYSVAALYHGGKEGSMVELVSESRSVLAEVVAVTDSLIYITAAEKIDDTSQFTDIRVIQ